MEQEVIKIHTGCIYAFLATNITKHQLELTNNRLGRELKARDPGPAHGYARGHSSPTSRAKASSRVRDRAPVSHNRLAASRAGGGNQKENGYDYKVSMEILNATLLNARCLINVMDESSVVIIDE